jgi:hypothetical protein
VSQVALKIAPLIQARSRACMTLEQKSALKQGGIYDLADGQVSES